VQERLSPELEAALQAEEAGTLNQIVRARRPEHLAQLRQVAADETAPPLYRSRAIYALGRWGDPAAVADIVRGLPTLNEQGRLSAMDALGRLATPDAERVLTDYAGDASPQVRKLVVEGLARTQGAAAQSTLRGIAERDPEGWLRELASRNVK
jgi:HEAT repeat protein